MTKTVSNTDTNENTHCLIFHCELETQELRRKVFLHVQVMQHFCKCLLGVSPAVHKSYNFLHVAAGKETGKSRLRLIANEQEASDHPEHKTTVC